MTARLYHRPLIRLFHVISWVIQAHYEPYRSALKIYSFIDPSPIVFIFLLIVDYLIIYISIRLELATIYSS